MRDHVIVSDKDIVVFGPASRAVCDVVFDDYSDGHFGFSIRKASLEEILQDNENFMASFMLHYEELSDVVEDLQTTVASLEKRYSEMLYFLKSSKRDADHEM